MRGSGGHARIIHSRNEKKTRVKSGGAKVKKKMWELVALL
jgi:hypothetical protein